MPISGRTRLAVLGVSLLLLCLAALYFIRFQGTTFRIHPDSTSDTPGRQAFHEELKALAKVVESRLASPPTDRFPPDKASARFLDAIELATVWPHPNFRTHLIRAFELDVPHLHLVAEALLAYREPGLRAIVQTRTNDRKVVHVWRSLDTEYPVTTGDLIRNELTRPLEPEGSFPRTEGIGLRFNYGGDYHVGWPTGMTVDRASAELWNPYLSFRFQSWAWLAEQGIVGPTHSVLEAWPQLGDASRTHVVCYSAKHAAGAGRLRKLYEDLLVGRGEKLREEVEGSLLVSLARLNSAAGRNRAKQIVEARVAHAQESPLGITDRLLRDALQAFCYRPEPEDVAVLIRLSGSPLQSVRSYALAGLSTLNQPEAIARVREALLLRDSSECYRVLESLESQAVEAETPIPRWEYLRVLEQAMRERTLVPPFHAKMLRTSAYLAGEDVGQIGYRSDVESVREAIDRCSKWLLGESFR